MYSEVHMKIAIVGANGKMGQRLIPLLTSRGHSVVAFVRAAPVAGATEVIQDWANNPRAGAALREADSIVNLAGSGNPPRGVTYAEANLAPAEAVRDLLGGKTAPHIVFISYPGTSETAASDYLVAKARGEQVTKDSAKRAAILRTSM